MGRQYLKINIYIVVYNLKIPLVAFFRNKGYKFYIIFTGECNEVRTFKTKKPTPPNNSTVPAYFVSIQGFSTTILTTKPTGLEMNILIHGHAVFIVINVTSFPTPALPFVDGFSAS